MVVTNTLAWELIPLTRLRIHHTQEWRDLYQADKIEDLARFLDRYTKDHKNGWESTPQIRLCMVGYNRPSVVDRVIPSYPPPEFTWTSLFLDASSRILTHKIPDHNGIVSYDAARYHPVVSSEVEDRSTFQYTFDKYTELCGFSKVRLYMSTDDHDDMDVYVVIKKLDRQGTILTHQNIPMEDLPQGTTLEDIPHENYWQYVGPNGRLRASHRAVATEKGYDPAKLSLLSKAYVYHPHDREEKVEPGQIVELEIMLWPGGMIFDKGEAMSLQVMGHVPIIPEFTDLEKNMHVVNKGAHKIHSGPEYPSSLLVALSSPNEAT